MRGGLMIRDADGNDGRDFGVRERDGDGVGESDVGGKLYAVGRDGDCPTVSTKA